MQIVECATYNINSNTQLKKIKNLTISPFVLVAMKTKTRKVLNSPALRSGREATKGQRLQVQGPGQEIR